MNHVALVDPDAENVLFDVVRNYGKYTAAELRNMTHTKGTPWAQVYQEGQIHVEIPLRLIQNYFSTLEALMPAEKYFSESDFIGYRDENGILVLPKDWDDESM